MKLFLVDVAHEFLKFVDVLLTHFYALLGVSVEVHGHPLQWCLVAATHAEERTVGAQSQQLVVKDVSLAIPSYDATCLPEGDVVQKLTTRNAYLANEQLIEVVGGQAFFGSPVSSSFLSSGSPLGTW